MRKSRSGGERRFRCCLTPMDKPEEIVGLLTDIELLELMQAIAVELELRLMQQAGDDEEFKLRNK